MSVLKSTVAKNAACNAVVDLIDTGSLRPYGTLNILTADSTVLSALRLTNPSFSNAVDGTATASTIYDNTSFIDGTAAFFGFYNRDSTYIWGGNITTVGGGGIMELNALSIPQDATFSITSVKYIVS